jgi:hypothetical protein
MGALTSLWIPSKRFSSSARAEGGEVMREQAHFLGRAVLRQFSERGNNRLFATDEHRACILRTVRA